MSSFAKLGLAAASAAALAALTAPSAQARPTCQETSTQTICETSGSVSIKARPGTTAPPASQPSIPWLLGIPGRG